MDNRASYYKQKSLKCKNFIPYYGIDPQITTCNTNGKTIKDGSCKTKEYFTIPPKCNQWNIYNQKECQRKP